MNMITAGFNFHTEEQGEGTKGLDESLFDLCFLLLTEVLILASVSHWPAFLALMLLHLILSCLIEYMNIFLLHQERQDIKSEMGEIQII